MTTSYVAIYIPTRFVWFGTTYSSRICHFVNSSDLPNYDSIFVNHHIILVFKKAKEVEYIIVLLLSSNFQLHIQTDPDLYVFLLANAQAAWNSHTLYNRPINLNHLALNYIVFF